MLADSVKLLMSMMGVSYFSAFIGRNYRISARIVSIDTKMRIE